MFRARKLIGGATEEAEEVIEASIEWVALLGPFADERGAKASAVELFGRQSGEVSYVGGGIDLEWRVQDRFVDGCGGRR